MKRFIARHAERITGVLSGLDRLVLRGTLRRIAFVEGLKALLWSQQVLLKDFASFVAGLTQRLKEASERLARRQGRPVQYLPSSQTSKEEVARRIAGQDGVTDGLIAVLTCVEPCRSFDIYRNRALKKLQLVARHRKCLFLYHYFIDPVFGFINARIQTWLPLSIQICINGREWLARQMDQAGLRYRRRDNCFVQLDDPRGAQELMDRQLKVAWPQALDRIAAQLNPIHDEIFRDFPTRYYWSAYQSEWATDLMFRDAPTLASIYPALVHHGMTSFSSPDVMRFLGQRPHWNFQKDVVSSFKDRTEGVRIKHWVGRNSVKLYDKEASVLRVETTLHDRRGFKVLRRSEADPKGAPSWRPLRAGIADLHRRAEVSQASNERYLDALASVDTTLPIRNLIQDVCQPTRWKKRPVRGLRPWQPHDVQLFQAVHRGEFCVQGFRNADLQALLFDRPAEDPLERRRRSRQVTRMIQMLRAHGLAAKVSGARRYRLTPKGRDVLSASLAILNLTLEQINKAIA